MYPQKTEFHYGLENLLIYTGERVLPNPCSISIFYSDYV